MSRRKTVNVKYVHATTHRTQCLARLNPSYTKRNK